jgi:hypothetical protein
LDAVYQRRPIQIANRPSLLNPEKTEIFKELIRIETVTSGSPTKRWMMDTGLIFLIKLIYNLHSFILSVYQVKGLLSDSADCTSRKQEDPSPS